MLAISLMIALAQSAGAAQPAQQAQPAPPSQQAQPAQTPPKCSGANYDAFDFWVGKWDVYPNGSAKKVANSTIEKLYRGCAVRENWMPLRGGGGGSLNAYDPMTGRWHQLWIGSAPGRVFFEGGPVGKTMVLTGYWNNVNGPGKHALVRMTYTPNSDGSVRQYGEASTDHGKTWQTSFDFIYRPKEHPKEHSTP